MSRSRKKEPVYKDPSNTEGKKFANRKLRRKTKISLHKEDETMPLLNEVMNAYDVVDFKIMGHKMKDKNFVEKLRRK